MTRLSFSVGLLCLVTIFGCQDSDTEVADSQDTTQNKSTNENAKSKPPVVKLIDAGQEPRQELRYTCKAGEEETMTMRIDTSMNMTGAQTMQMKVPTQVMTMAIKVEKVDSEGNMTVTSKLTKADVLGTPGVQRQVVDAVRTETKKLVGLATRGEITDRGQVLKMDATLPDSASPQVKQMIGSLNQSLSQISTVLPKEAVGVGGKWSVSMSVEAGPMKLQQTATYVVKELTAEGMKLDVAIQQTAPAQKITPPGQSIAVQMESYSGNGKGTMEVRFADTVPTSELRIQNTNVVLAGSQRLTTKGDIRMKVSTE